ncbi:hypothetical protein L1887_20939 [Cichorium endivia]|nr:hypothetical protein L1887_20939 [Cichorium endivia]
MKDYDARSAISELFSRERIIRGFRPRNRVVKPRIYLCSSSHSKYQTNSRFAVPNFLPFFIGTYNEHKGLITPLPKLSNFIFKIFPKFHIQQIELNVIS